MIIRQILKDAAEKLEGVGVADPLVDASLLLAHVTGRAPLTLRADSFSDLPQDQQAEFEKLLARRLSHEPLQYILGAVEFMDLTLCVSPDALIPRYDTEILCEEALRRIEDGMRVLDLCTGTGAIALTLKKHADCRVFASDISEKALALAQKNAQKNALTVDFRLGDLLSPFENEVFDMIVSNPPYISAADMRTLSPEVLSEPHLALHGGNDGLNFYRRIVATAPKHLAPGGWLLFEIGCEQGKAVAQLMEKDFAQVQVVQDLAHLDRVVLGRKKG